jgi:mannose-6-phosphate isomerase
MNITDLYPLKFQPIIKDKIWGGTKLKTVLNKSITTDKAGESWEISGVKGDISVISNGNLRGKNLHDIISEYKAELVGERVFSVYGEEFPLLIKFIDAQEDLSIQVHPNDDLARKRHNSFGKTEMWYVIDSDEGAELISGFNQDLDKSTYLNKLNDGKITEILNSEKVDNGDVFFIPVGRVHAIKSGILLAEIQQTSDITYRIYDWDRVEENGQGRELHTEYALDALDFKKYDNYKTEYSVVKNKRVLLEKSPYFETNIYELDRNINISYSALDSFVIFMVMNGEITINYENGNINASKGETILIPAAITKLEIEVVSEAKILEVYIPKLT